MEPTSDALRREIKQARPFRSMAEEATLAVLRTADVLRRRLSEAMEPFGITMQQYNVLRILRGAGEDGLPTLEIAERMLERQPGITRLLDRLERKGWIARVRCPHDRRQVLCSITPSGLALLERMDDDVATADEKAVVGLSEEDARSLVRLLEAVRAAE